MPDSKLSHLRRLKDKLHHLFVGGEDVGREKEPTRLQQFFHFWRLAAESFVKNRLPVRAASLSYTTILALVPMLAVAVGITSSLLKDESVEQIGVFVDRFVEHVVPDAELEDESSHDEPSNDATAGAEALTPGPGGLDDAGLIVSTNAGNVVDPDHSGESDATPQETHVLDRDAQDVVARSLKDFISRTRSGTLGILGTTALVFLAISMLIRIETAFNDVWGVRKGRTLFMRLVLYWTVISLAPILFATTLGLASGPYFATTERLISDIPLFGWLLFQLLPVFVLWVAFAVFYILMPNTKVDWDAALIGGGVASLLWHSNHALSVFYVSRVADNYTLYGGLGLVPVFMIGLYFAWMIVLFGGQVSYAWQNRLAYFQERVTDNINQRGKEFVALRLMTAIGAAYQQGADPPSPGQMATDLEIPPRLTLQVLQTLTGARLLTEVNTTDSGYVPARPLESISCHDILHAMRAGQGHDVISRESALQQQILGEFLRINEAEKHAAQSVSLQSMAQRANALAALPAPAKMALPDAGKENVQNEGGHSERG